MAIPDYQLCMLLDAAAWFSTAGTLYPCAIVVAAVHTGHLIFSARKDEFRARRFVTLRINALISRLAGRLALTV